MTPFETYLGQVLRAGITFTLADFESLSAEDRATMIAVSERLQEQRIGMLALAMQNPLFAIELMHGKEAAEDAADYIRLASLAQCGEEMVRRNGHGRAAAS